MLVASPQRAQTAAALLQSAHPDAQGRVDFKQFCASMLPKGVDPTLSERVAQYMVNSFE